MNASIKFFTNRGQILKARCMMTFSSCIKYALTIGSTKFLSVIVFFFFRNSYNLVPYEIYAPGKVTFSSLV